MNHLATERTGAGHRGTGCQRGYQGGLGPRHCCVLVAGPPSLPWQPLCRRTLSRTPLGICSCVQRLSPFAWIPHYESSSNTGFCLLMPRTSVSHNAAIVGKANA